MNLMRMIQAGHFARRLATSTEATTLHGARSQLLAIGPEAIRPVFEVVARGKSANVAVDVLVSLLDNDTLGQYTEALRSPVPPVVEAATAALSRGKNYDPMLLFPLYSDARVSKARLEAILLAQMPRMQPAALVRALPDLSKDSRSSVFRMLEQSADLSVAEEAKRLVGHSDWWMRLHAVKLLARVPGADATESLVKLLADDNAAIRIECLRAISALQATGAVPAVCRRLRDGDIRVQTAAIETLTGLGDASAVPHLLDCLKDESEYVRRAAVEVLNAVVTTDAIKDLVSALRDSDWWVRVRAADALGTLGGPRVIDAVIELVRDSDDFIRRYAVEILNLVPDPRAVDALIIALDDHDWWVRERAVDALAKAADKRAVAPLLRLLELGDARVTPLCIKALAAMPDERAIDAIARMASSDADDVRREALVALRTFAKAELPADAQAHVFEVLRTLNAAGARGDAHAPGAPLAGSSPEAGRAAERPVRPAPAPAPQPAPAADPAPTPAAFARDSRLDYQRLEPETLLADRFRVLRRIGGGGFGTVYLVEDVVVHEEIVLKVLSPHLSLDELMIRRFVQELRLSRRITHRNVIRIHDLIDLRGAHAISMEYFDGRDLGSALREDGPMAWERALGVAAQVADGLVAAHELGIIHRDIKPANLLLGDGDLVKIVDFGLASVGQSTRSRLTQSGILVGTPEYISPEQITGTDVDGRTDLYSLGVVLYELVSGQQPFHGPNAVNVLFQHLEPNVPRLKELRPEVPDEVDELVMACMARDAAARPADARSLLERITKAA